ncbi:MAG: GNAT family N-acetyltransferase [Runella sp.]
MIQLTTATTDQDLHQILTLQRQNLYKNTSAEYQTDQGFTTVEHTFEALRQMTDTLPQIIAKENETVVGYALAMPRSLAELVPELRPMFELLDRLMWQDTPLYQYQYYVMGQICIAPSQRGKGLFDALYGAHRRQFADMFELCVTEVAVRNTRSMRAHERVGFRAIHQYRDHTDLWNVVVWDWRQQEVTFSES